MKHSHNLLYEPQNMTESALPLYWTQKITYYINNDELLQTFTEMGHLLNTSNYKYQQAFTEKRQLWNELTKTMTSWAFKTIKLSTKSR
jgi:hypothetical protein